MDEAIPHMVEAIHSMETKPTVFFDFSAGDGALGQKISGMEYKAIDIAPPENTTKVEQGDFLKFDKHENYQKCMVGFNPPFGRGGNLAAEFIRHAFKFNPCGFALILPLRRWTFHGFHVFFQKILPENAFFLPASKKNFDTASIFIVLVRDWTVPIHELTVSENGDASKLIAEDCEAIRWKGPKNHTLLVRKVGAYAGQHIYCLAPLTENTVQVVYVDHTGKVSEPETFTIPAKDQIVSPENSPWGRNGHVVCNQDTPPNYAGSNPNAKAGAKRRVGTGFLKCSTKNIATFPELVNLAQEIRETMIKYNLAKGAPKSINKGVLESIV